MDRKSLFAAIGAALLLLTYRSSSGAIIVYTDRASYLAAIGKPAATDSFSEFSADQSFRTAPVALNGFSLSQEGYDQQFRNLIDVPPLQTTDNNGTANASCFVNAAEAGTLATNVRITLLPGTAEFGGDFYGISGGSTDEGLTANIVVKGNVADTYTFTGIANESVAQFFGVVDTDSSIDSILLSSTTVTPGSGGDGFSIDDTATAAALPEPTIGLAAIGTGFLLASRRRARNHIN